MRSKLIDGGETRTLAKAIQMGQYNQNSQARLKSISGTVPTKETHAMNQGKQA